MRNYMLLLVFLTTLPLFSQNLNDHLLLRYSFDGNTNDISGNGYDGVPFGVTYGPDRFGNPNSACYFNGIDNYVNFPNLNALKPNFPFSFSFWINYASEDYNKQVVFNTSFEENRCTGVWFNSSIDQNSHAINVGNGNYYYAPDSRNTLVCYKHIDLNLWNHIIVVVNSATDMKMYIGCLDNPGVYTGTGGSLVYSDTPGCIGRHDRYLDASPGYFNGLIDDFRYWDRALTEDDITQLCSALSVEESDYEKDAITIYPNPAFEKIYLDTNLNEIKSIAMYNSVGQEIYAGTFTNSIDVSNFPAGVYFLSIKNGDKIINKKVVIR